MTDEQKDSIDSLLNQVQPTRRQFLKRSLLAGGVIALTAPSSTILAQTTPAPGIGVQDQGQGKGKGKGQGKGKGKGQGKGSGKGKGKGST